MKCALEYVLALERQALTHTDNPLTSHIGQLVLLYHPGANQLIRKVVDIDV